jgi:outer membrane protein TolC
MRHLPFLLTLAAVCVASGPCWSEDLSLEDALRIADENSPAVAAAAAEIEAAEAGIALAGARSWPTLAASGSYGTFSGDVLYGRFLPGAPGDGTTPVGDYDTNQLANLELKQVLYAGGAIGAEKRLREVEHEFADERWREQRLDVELEVVMAYYGTVLAERRLEVAGRAVARSQEGLAAISARHQEEEALDVELLGAESKVAADELALLEAGRTAELARHQLDLLLGRQSGAPLTLTTELDRPLDVPPGSDALDRAVSASPTVRQAELAVARAEAAANAARAQGRPKLELTGLYSWIDNELFFRGDYAAASLNLGIPFFQDIKAARAASRAAEARGREAAHLRRQAENGVDLALARSYGRLEVALAAVEVARRNLAYHAEHDRVTRSAYREQLATFADVLDRHDALSRAELALHEAHFEARMAEAEILRIVGE